MLRRRTAARRAVDAADDPRSRLDVLRDRGWVLPRAIDRDEPPAWTLVGTLDSPWATAVDPSGLITPSGPHPSWSLDWWIGADDRWHLPSSDAAVRQHLIGGAPVVETMVRIPGGDAVERVYAFRGEAFPGGDEWLVVEVENRSSVPFALAFGVRPMTPEGVGAVSSIEMAPVRGGRGQGRDSAHAISVDGRPALVFGRRPARIAGSTAADGDVAAVVLRGDAGEVTGTEPWAGAACPDGLAQAAFVLPVAHTATVRVVLPIGAEPATRPAWPPVIPPVAHVVAGWDTHTGRASRMEIPAPQLAEAAAAAHRSLLLAPWSDGLRRAGPPRGRSARPASLADTGRIVAALDRLGHHPEAARTLGAWPDVLATIDASLEDDRGVIEAVAAHRLLGGDAALFDDLLPDVVACVSRLDRSRRKSSGLVEPATVRSLVTLARALDVSGQAEGAASVRSVAARLGDTVVPIPPDATDPVSPRTRLLAAIDAIATGSPTGLDLLEQTLALASPTFGFAGPGEPQDLVAAALLLDAVRAVLVQDGPGGLDLLSVFPPQWYGGPVEVHDVPTAHGLLSYALRWHGTRPALLWELDQPTGHAPARIAVPGLDPDWSSTQPRGEALLAEVSPPASVKAVRLVTEHPGDAGTFA